VVFVIDMREATPGTFNSTSVSFLSDVFEEAFPAMFKTIILINMPWWVNAIYTIIKVFLPAKLQSRVLRTSQELMHKLVDPSQLPPTFGGTNAFSQSHWIQQMKAVERST